jgi:hypothetical protein
MLGNALSERAYAYVMVIILIVVAALGIHYWH